MSPVSGLSLQLPQRGSRRRLAALHAQLRGAIMAGRLRPGLRLPSTRALAEELGVSRNTVVTAYDLLLGEGYIQSRRGSGHFVADVVRGTPRIPGDAGQAMQARLDAAWRQAVPLDVAGTAPRFDFRLGVPDADRFPFEIWRRLSARALRAFSRLPGGYDTAQGRPALRAAIAGHVSFTRAVACEAGDVLVTAGAQQAFDLLARVLVTPGRTVVAVEDPGYPWLREAFAMAGARIVAVPVDAEGLVVERVPPEAAVVCVTPSHQFPTGVVMSPRRRAALLEHARARRAVIVEDDYDSEFRYGGRPLDALQTLDRDATVCYVGTFSKSLFPALRLGYVVAPDWARPALLAARQLSGWHGDVVAQETLAAFIAGGHLGRHVRRMRRVYAARRGLLLDALAQHAVGRLSPLPSEAGLHLAARLTGAVPALEVARQAVAVGIAVEHVARYAQGAAGRDLLAFGFGAIADADVEPAVRRLARLL